MSSAKRRGGSEPALERDVALANLIIERFGLSNAFGHASARVPARTLFYAHAAQEAGPDGSEPAGRDVFGSRQTRDSSRQRPLLRRERGSIPGPLTTSG